MGFGFRYAARSVVGLVRSSNQDSAYASPNMLVVADGMGGHAGGDVASTIAVEILRHLDHPTHTPATALTELQRALDHSQVALTRASQAAPQLQGLGTTVVCLLRTDTTLVMAHMGDSRAYLLRGSELSQVTTDHTYVQHLVDLGRITPDEAEHHPQRNVVMRVLSDFDLDLPPEVSIREARVGDRWLLCSDGLSGFVAPEQIGAVLRQHDDPARAAETLINLAMLNQSTDNVTCLVADIVPADQAARAVQHTEVVGAAASGGPLPDLVAAVVAGEDWDDDAHDDAVPMQPPTQPTEVVPAKSAGQVEAAPATTAQIAGQARNDNMEIAGQARNDELSSDPQSLHKAEGASYSRVDPLYFTDDDDASARPAPRRRPWVGALVVALVVLGLGIGLWQGYAWTQQQHFVGISAGHVAVFRGIPETIGPLGLSEPVRVFAVPADSLPELYRRRLADSIRAESLADAVARAEQLFSEAGVGAGAQPQSSTTGPPTPYFNVVDPPPQVMLPGSGVGP